MDNKDSMFPILRRVLKNDGFVVNRLQPKHMDKLGEEVALAFQRCALPESDNIVVDEEERQFNEAMMFGIEIISHLLTKRSNNSTNSHDGALLMLYHDTVITVTNLQNLFRMCDPNVRTGRVRCHALSILNVYGGSNNKSTYDLLIPTSTADSSLCSAADGGSGEAAVAPMMISFGKKIIAVMATALTQKGYCKHPRGEKACVCWGVPWFTLSWSLKRTTALASEKPAAMIDLLDSYHWPSILQDMEETEGLCQRDSNRMVYFDETLFVKLHHWAGRLLADDPENSKAKTFLREQLGSCHELLRKCLRRIISRQIFASEDELLSLGGGTTSQRAGPITSGPTSPPTTSGPTLDEMESPGSFLQRFVHCLAPAPVDRETMELVRQARNVLHGPYVELLMSARSRNDTSEKEIKQLEITADILEYMEDEVWYAMHIESDQARWNRSCDFFFTGDFALKADKRKLKKSVERYKKEHNVRTNFDDGEFCANCFVLEKTLLLDEQQQSNESKQQRRCLMKCGQCQQMKYCSRECQLEHWKKAHKKHCCKKAEKTASSSANKSKP